MLEDFCRQDSTNRMNRRIVIKGRPKWTGADALDDSLKGTMRSSLSLEIDPGTSKAYWLNLFEFFAWVQKEVL
jgi:hypothetical protein